MSLATDNKQIRELEAKHIEICSLSLPQPWGNALLKTIITIHERLVDFNTHSISYNVFAI